MSSASQAILMSQAKARCRFEWSTTNDPPCHPNDDNWNGCSQCIDRHGLIAALQTLADHVVPANGSRKNNEIRDEILSIANQLNSTL